VGGVKDLRKVMSGQKIDDVVITLPQHAHGQVSELLMALHNFPVNFRVTPNYFSLTLGRVTLDYFGGSPF
jgi:FlaA1/EpsC-like NDP-sugar epimerase